MVKWIVAGKPRMALFAGDRPIMTGEELTYDYNFDPFSAKNVQECRCGVASCRGVLGPRPKDKPKPTVTLGETIKQVARAGKRKLEELIMGEKDVDKNPKKRKIAVPVKRSASTKAIDAAKGIKRSLSNALITASKGRRSAVQKEPGTPKRAEKSKNRSGRGKKQTYLSSSRNSSLTLVNIGPSKAKGKGKGKAKEVKVESDSESSPAKAVKQVKERKLSAKAKELYRNKKHDTSHRKGRVM
jgi:[histone H3]-lysine4 N-trimethyltransferase ASH1L